MQFHIRTLKIRKIHLFSCTGSARCGPRPLGQMSFSVNINYARPAAPPAANVGTFLIATARTEASSCPFNTIVDRLHAYLHKISSY